MDSTSTNPTARFAILGRLRGALDDRTFFRRGMVVYLFATAAGFALLHTIGVLAGLADFFDRDGPGALSYPAAFAVAALGAAAGLAASLWVVRRATDIGAQKSVTLLCLQLWLIRIAVEAVALWLMFALFTNGVAMLIAGGEGAWVFGTVFGSGMETIVDDVFDLDIDGEGWFRLLGLIVGVGGVLAAYAIALVGYFVIDLLELLLRFYSRGGDYFGRDASDSATDPQPKTGLAKMLGFTDKLAASLDDRSLFSRGALTAVRLAVVVSALGVIGIGVRGLFHFYDGPSDMVDHGISKLFALFVPIAAIVLAALWVRWTELSKSGLREPDQAGGALGIAFRVLRHFVELAALGSVIAFALVGFLMFFTGEDVFVIGFGFASGGTGAGGGGGDASWFTTRLAGLVFMAGSVIAGFLYAFAGYVGHDALDAVVRFFQAGGRFFERKSREDR